MVKKCPKRSKISKMVKDCPKWSEIVQNCQILSKMLKDGPRLSKMILLVHHEIESLVDDNQKANYPAITVEYSKLLKVA